MGKIFSKKINPVDFIHETVMEKIFDELSGRDLLMCSLVSKDWHAFIGRSKICMKKIELKFHNFEGLSKANMDLLMSTQREYSSLSISNIDACTRVKIILAHFRWRNVKICNLKFTNDIDFLDFLGFLEPSVEKLGFKNVKIVELSSLCGTDYTFPQLRHLEIKASSRFILTTVFSKYSDFTKLSLDIPCEYFEGLEWNKLIEAVQNILLNNIKLKNLHLGLSCSIFDYVFTDEIVESIRFTLESLKVHRFRITQTFRNSLALNNFEMFLFNQSKSMKFIHIEQWLGFNVLSIIYNEMNIVKSVIIRDLPNCRVYEDLRFLIINQNPSILHLNLYTFTRHHEIFEIILEASPNLKTLKMFSMNQSVLNLLASNHHQLEKLLLDCITAENPPRHDAFPNLKFLCANLFISSKFREAFETSPSINLQRTNIDQNLINLFNDFRLFWSH